MQLEVVDKMCVSAMKVAKVQEVVGGRLRLHYTDSKVQHLHIELSHSENIAQNIDNQVKIRKKQQINKMKNRYFGAPTISEKEKYALAVILMHEF